MPSRRRRRREKAKTLGTQMIEAFVAEADRNPTPSEVADMASVARKYIDAQETQAHRSRRADSRA